MKWFKNTTDQDAIKKEYRQLARRYHPDVSTEENAEECFKEIVEEYTRLQQKVTHYETLTFDEVASQQKIIDAMAAIKEIIDEVYPRLKVDYVAWVLYGFMEFGQAPIRKVCHCLEIAQKFMPSNAIYCTFTPKTRKKAAEVRYDPGRRAFFIDGAPESFDTYLDAECTYKGRRYLVHTNKVWQRLEDTKEQKDYYLRRSPKIKIEELFGL